MDTLFRFPEAQTRDPAVDQWMLSRSTALASLARHWFDAMRACGVDVRELLHDGHPTACVGEAAFAYVDAFTNHVNVGFYRGAELPDPRGLLQGSGKLMRHVKVRPGERHDAEALDALIRVAYADMGARVGATQR